MEYTHDLLLRLDGLGIDMSKGPADTKRQLAKLYEETRYNTFGYLEDLEKFDRIFEPVYGLEFFILVRDVQQQFFKEIKYAELASELNEIHEQSKINRHEYKND